MWVAPNLQIFPQTQNLYWAPTIQELKEKFGTGFVSAIYGNWDYFRSLSGGK